MHFSERILSLCTWQIYAWTIFKKKFCNCWEPFSILHILVQVNWDCCMFSSGQFPGVWILYADVSEHSLPSSTCLRRWNRQSVPKRRHITFRCPEENIHHTEHGEGLKSEMRLLPGFLLPSSSRHCIVLKADTNLIEWHIAFYLLARVQPSTTLPWLPEPLVHCSTFLGPHLIHCNVTYMNV